MDQVTPPVEVHNGLAIYRRGGGPPALMFPYPHASGGGPMIDGALASLAVGCGFSGLYLRPARPVPVHPYQPGHPRRILDCAAETLDVLGLSGLADVAGHSMSALCAFCFALAHHGRIARLVLIGTPPGSGLAIVRYRAMPFHWPPWHPDLWRMLIWGNLLAC